LLGEGQDLSQRSYNHDLTLAAHFARDDLNVVNE